MSDRWIRAVVPTLVIALGACSSDQGPDLDGLPPASGSEVWSYLVQESYDSLWALWPGKSRMYESAAVEHGVRLTTYVNDVALGAINAGQLVMPTGSIIVKENFVEGNLMAVTTMYKVQGFAPDANDWLWLQNDPAGQVMAEGRVQMCIGCHVGASATDLVFLLGM